MLWYIGGWVCIPTSCPTQVYHFVQELVYKTINYKYFVIRSFLSDQPSSSLPLLCFSVVAQFMYIIRRRINLPSEKAMFLFVNKVLPTTRYNTRWSRWYSGGTGWVDCLWKWLHCWDFDGGSIYCIVMCVNNSVCILGKGWWSFTELLYRHLLTKPPIAIP